MPHLDPSHLPPGRRLGALTGGVEDALRLGTLAVGCERRP
jgi:hypothetical protein